MASYASAYRQRYSNMGPAMVDPTINCAIVQFFLPGRSMPEHEAVISLIGGDYVVSLSP